MSSPMVGGRFLDAVLPLLRTGDRAALCTLLRNEWPPERLTGLLRCGRSEVQKTAAVCLGLVGAPRHCTALAAMLHHPDPYMARFAERALWELWMNGGSADGNARLARAIRLIAAEALDRALVELRELVALEPQFTEAHHQTGIALYLVERVVDAASAFQRAIDLCPCHFGAIVGLGHAYAFLGDASAALDHYRRALRVHPRLDGLPELIARIQSSQARPRVRH